MCLNINQNLHAGDYSQKKVQCYKVLVEENGNYRTPYQQTQVDFINGKATLRLIGNLQIEVTRYGSSVNAGIHACVTKEKAKAIVRNISPDRGPVICKAYIPEAVVYIKGNNEDIVAKELVIIKPTKKKKAVKKKQIKKAKNASNTNTRSRNARKRKK